jgi:hypothetical protein
MAPIRIAANGALRRRAVPLPDYAVAPRHRKAVRRQPAGLAEAGHAVGAERLSVEQSTYSFMHSALPPLTSMLGLASVRLQP